MQRFIVRGVSPCPDDGGKYVLHSEAQAEIARLQAEVERLGLLLNGKWQSVERAEDNKIWNDAIEAAADILAGNESKITEPYGKVLLGTYAVAIRALKLT